SDLVLRSELMATFHNEPVGGHSRVSLTASKEAVKLLQFHLKRAHGRMKNQADRHKTDKEFDEGTWVYLKLQPYRQTTKCKSEVKEMGNFPICDEAGLMFVEPLAVLDKRMHKQGKKDVVYVLIQWANGSGADATWNQLKN
nr:reverse transcriptase [Tanacetum cinerariifolium]